MFPQFSQAESNHNIVQEPLWIFGYGSLIWRADFPFLESRLAAVDGYARRFWQGSTDHRGVPGAPGRVVTLIDAPGERCWGRAYRLDPGHGAAVLAQLDYREKNGYERLQLPTMLDCGQQLTAITYRAAANNPHYLGPASAASIASQIASAHGPSGSNRQYLLELRSALAVAGQPDEHVDELARLVEGLSG